MYTMSSFENHSLMNEATRAGLARAIGDPSNVALKIAKACLTEGKSIDEIWAKRLVERQFGNAEWLVDLEHIWPRATSL